MAADQAGKTVAFDVGRQEDEPEHLVPELDVPDGDVLDGDPER